ncbi:C-C chemokine receptor type 3-like [Mytilus trossulus]|uniref:C-C chemokine receptor type 3-like n=1 Tax=Mytilus trossulus TaxID=6551 RepID=UPI0030077084
MANVTVGATLLFENITTNASTIVDDFDTSVYNDVEKYLWIIFSPLFLMIGLVGNLLNICVLLRLKFYKNATYTLLFILAFTDLTVLFIGLTRYLIKYASSIDIRVLSEFSCRFSLFLIYFSMQFSSWILVLVTVIRFMKTFVPLRRTASKDITIKNTLVILLIAAIVLIGINLHFFGTNGITDKGKCSSLTPGYLEFDEKVFVYIDFVSLSILPAGIMIVLNALICYELSKLTKTRRRMSIQTGMSPLRRQKSTKRVTWMLLVTTSYFIVATIPISIYFIVDSYVRPGADASTKSRLDIAWTITYLFQYSHFALNFYLYTATNEKFRKELTALTKNVYHRISTSSNQPIKPAPSREYSSDSKKLSATQST